MSHDLKMSCAEALLTAFPKGFTLKDSTQDIKIPRRGVLVLDKERNANTIASPIGKLVFSYALSNERVPLTVYFTEDLKNLIRFQVNSFVQPQGLDNRDVILQNCRIQVEEATKRLVLAPVGEKIVVNGLEYHVPFTLKPAWTCRFEKLEAKPQYSMNNAAKVLSVTEGESTMCLTFQCNGSYLQAIRIPKKEPIVLTYHKLKTAKQLYEAICKLDYILGRYVNMNEAFMEARLRLLKEQCNLIAKYREE